MSSNLCFLEEAHGNNANRNTTHHFTPQAICTPGLYTVYIMALFQSLASSLAVYAVSCLLTHLN